MATMAGPTGELTCETESIDVTGGSRPDENWRYTDRRGHEHYWRDGYPTLVYGARPGLWMLRAHPGRLTARRRLRDFRPTQQQCRICAEPIKPPLTSGGGWREFAPGLTQWYFNGQPVTPEQAEGIRMSWAAMTVR